MREVAVLTEGWPPWWHQALVLALPPRAGCGGELTSRVWGGHGGKQCPP